MPAPLHTPDNLLNAQARYMHWLLRTPLAAVMLYHGLEKWLVIGVSEFAQTMGLPMALAIIVAASEVAAGVALLAGVIAGDWITRAGAALACPVLLGAVFYVHWGQWHFLPTATHPMGGMAFQITLLGVAIYLLIRGNEV